MALFDFSQEPLHFSRPKYQSGLGFSQAGAARRFQRSEPCSASEDASAVSLYIGDLCPRGGFDISCPYIAPLSVGKEFLVPIDAEIKPGKESVPHERPEVW
jgi:hypothetical protein